MNLVHWIHLGHVHCTLYKGHVQWIMIWRPMEKFKFGGVFHCASMFNASIVSIQTGPINTNKIIGHWLLHRRRFSPPFCFFSPPFCPSSPSLLLPLFILFLFGAYPKAALFCHLFAPFSSPFCFVLTPRMPSFATFLPPFRSPFQVNWPP